MTFIKTSVLNGIAVVIKMLTLLGINKILAIYVGPSGYATLGQFQNAVQMIITFASGAINTGVIKYTSEYYDDQEEQRKVWATAGVISILGSTLGALLLIIFATPLASLLLADSNLYSIFYWLAAGLVLFVLNALLLAILNGKKEIQLYVIANICGSLLSFALTVFLAIYYGLYGALVALSIYQSVAFFITICLCHKAKWFKVRYLWGTVDKAIIIKLSKFSLMVAVSAACVPLSQILIRNYLSEQYGVDFAGLWEALTRLSGAYMMFITTTLSVYLLPRYSEIKQSIELKNEVIKSLIIVIPVAIVCSSTVFILKEWFVLFLFTKDFLPMTDLVAWQAVGDTLKISSWILGFLLWAKALTAAFIITEIFFSFSLYVITVLLSPVFGEQGVVIAYAINYFLYFLALSVYFYFWFRKSSINELSIAAAPIK